ncbi:MAG: DNA primase [Candidatus Omnitrophota bacterium]
MIPNEVINRILDRVDIVEIISGYVPLKKAGQNFKARCPFHQEKTPSFMVNPAKQIFHCFGCGAGGNVISFLMKYEKMDFIEAIKTLADKANVPLPRQRPGEREKTSFAERLYEVNNLACGFFQENLAGEAGREARRYFIQRGLNERTIKHFRLGFAQDSWRALIDYCKRKNVGEDILEKAGLVLLNETNRNFYDRFRARIIFPIFSLRNRVLGFGARALGEAMPKYMNSPETHVYSKGKQLYGMNFAKEFIRRQGYVVIAEGYFDLILPFQNDVKNVVATLGTALTLEQIGAIRRFTKNVIMIYDSDTAGEAAALRGLDLLIGQDMNVRIAVLPKGNDPDSFVRKEGRDGFMRVLGESRDLFDYKLGTLTAKFKKSEPRSTARIVEEMLPTLARIKNAVLKSGYLKKMSEELSVDEESIRTELGKVRPEYARDYSARVGPEEPQLARRAEMTLLAIALEDTNSAATIEEKLGFEKFKSKTVVKILEKITALQKSGKKVIPSHLVSCFEDAKIEEIIAKALSIAPTIQDRDKGLRDCFRHILDENVKEAARNNPDIHEVKRLIAEHQNMLKSLSGGSNE